MSAERLPDRWVAIDPGIVHCGVAYFEAVPSGEGVAQDAFCVEHRELSPTGLYLEARSWPERGIGQVVIEDYMLIKGRNAAGSRVETVKTIGVLEYLADEMQIAHNLQPPSVKSLANTWARTQGVEFDGRNVHVKDAQRHGWYFAWHRQRQWAAKARARNSRLPR